MKFLTDIFLLLEAENIKISARYLKAIVMMPAHLYLESKVPR